MLLLTQIRGAQCSKEVLPSVPHEHHFLSSCWVTL